MNTKKFLLMHAALFCALLFNLYPGYATAKERAVTPQEKVAPQSGNRQEFLAGYLATDQAPGSLRLLPAPPALGSAAFALDEDDARRTFAVRQTARYALALSDFDLNFPHAAGTFSCALNAPVTEKDTPRLYLLLRRTMTDVAMSTRAAKGYYKRPRPFMVNHEPICAPEMRAMLESDGSYPSGHTAIGWAWALILTEISPDQTDAILVRGRAFGESRNVCNHHWYSDVQWGRVMGAATVARLHAVEEFRRDLDAAREELLAVRKKGLTPVRNCSEEAAALAQPPY